MRLSEQKPEWHGWQNREVALSIGPLPDRKSIAMWAKTFIHVDTKDGGFISSIPSGIMAYFRSETAAKLAQGAIDSLMEPLMRVQEALNKCPNCGGAGYTLLSGSSHNPIAKLPCSCYDFHVAVLGPVQGDEDVPWLGEERRDGNQ